MIYYVDIDNTICHTKGINYPFAEPIHQNIEKINKLYEEGHTIIYWTARGSVSNMDWTELTIIQLKEWGCRHHKLRMDKPFYDIMICDRTKRIEEI